MHPAAGIRVNATMAECRLLQNGAAQVRAIHLYACSFLAQLSLLLFRLLQLVWVVSLCFFQLEYGCKLHEPNSKRDLNVF